MLVEPANKLLSAVDKDLSLVPEEEAAVITDDLEHVGDPLCSSSFVDETSLLSSSLTEQSLSQSFSLAEDLPSTAGDNTADSLSLEQSNHSTNPQTFVCGCTRILKGKPCSTLFSPHHYQEMRDNCAELLKSKLDNIVKAQIMAFT